MLGVALVLHEVQKGTAFRSPGQQLPSSQSGASSNGSGQGGKQFVAAPVDQIGGAIDLDTDEDVEGISGAIDTGLDGTPLTPSEEAQLESQKSSRAKRREADLAQAVGKGQVLARSSLGQACMRSLKHNDKLKDKWEQTKCAGSPADILAAQNKFRVDWAQTEFTFLRKDRVKVDRSLKRKAFNADYLTLKELSCKLSDQKLKAYCLRLDASFAKNEVWDDQAVKYWNPMSEEWEYLWLKRCDTSMAQRMCSQKRGPIFVCQMSRIASTMRWSTFGSSYHVGNLRVAHQTFACRCLFVLCLVLWDTSRLPVRVS